MNVLLLAAGLGTRLRPLTDNIPKCLVIVKNQILLDIWMKNIISNKLNLIFINTHYLHEKVEFHIKSNYKFPVNILYEPFLLGTYGTISNNIHRFINDDLLVIHADNYTRFDLNYLIEAHNHRPKTCLMTMLTFSTNSPHECGIVELDNDNVLIDFYEKSPLIKGNIANAAIYIFSRELLQELALLKFQITDIAKDLIPLYKSRIYTYHTSEIFLDIGTIENYKIANNLN
jgi:mannose-1-phosphate guanylyltransferase